MNRVDLLDTSMVAQRGAASSASAATSRQRELSRPIQRSWLYECRVLHHRFTPREHRFAYRLFYFAFDLDELPALHDRLRFFSLGHANLYAFHERDFLPLDEPSRGPASHEAATLRPVGRASLKARVTTFCAAHGVALGAGARVQLITLPRVFGHQFNPVSFYFCFDAGGAPRAAIAEVTNTFREVKPYFIPLCGSTTAGEFRLRMPKHFYVSPFSSVDVEFDFNLRLPGERLTVQIDDYESGRRILHSTLTGERVRLNDGRLAWFLLKYPIVTLGIVARIHWQALQLWFKRVPFFRKADAAAHQRDLYRPHSSIAKTPLP